MKKKIALIFFVMITTLLSSTFGLTPIGPPKSSDLREGQWTLGIELSHNNMDLETLGTVIENQLSPLPAVRTNDYTKYQIENLKSTMLMANLNTGIWDNWDIFLRLGLTKTQGDITEILASGSTGEEFEDFDSSAGFAWGLGTKVDFYEDAEITWGGVCQVTFANPDGSSVTQKSEATFNGDAEISYWEIHVAIGPTIEYDTYRLYGGPFLHLVNGDLDIDGRYVDSVTPGGPYDISLKSSHDIREESQLGGFAGAQWYLGNNTSMYTELQFTGDAWGVGFGTIWRY